ncbi:tripartite tricarboxylate transporter family receptor domain-containing protein [Ditylenchus destructor]|uniref:Tripartite tricarboxylate transporter family receptor domain-containing protein n=1 Tax=Ditylenchus destructor TaxID=166010 RepID=A0AAD4MGT7_9BILA|nr:tripartite tricarboxylate transporter family receptor domain-containing protein [Ditylenchus destructor]
MRLQSRRTPIPKTGDKRNEVWFDEPPGTRLRPDHPGRRTPVALAQDQKPIEWVVGYAAGGGSDTVARTIAEEMGKSLKRTIIVSNKPGAATNIAADYVAKSKDYGNIMFTADFATLAANPALFAKLPYDAEKDFVPVGMLARFPLLLVVHPSNPANNLKEFIAWVKANPNGANFASAGAGSPQHLAAETVQGTHRARAAARGLPRRRAGGHRSRGRPDSVRAHDSATVQQYVVSGKLKALGVAARNA